MTSALPELCEAQARPVSAGAARSVAQPPTEQSAPVLLSSSLPLFADSFRSTADFSALAALIEEEDDEQRDRERAARDEGALKRKGKRMEVDATAGAAELPSSAPASTTRLHRGQRQQAAHPYSRAATRSQKLRRPTPIQPRAEHSSERRDDEAGKALTAAETTLFMRMWKLDAQVG